ncbi:hypothetical protein HDU98_005361, partial [Podochytrium sp. JEL0797]
SSGGCVWNDLVPVATSTPLVDNGMGGGNPDSSQHTNLFYIAVIPVVILLIGIAFKSRNFSNSRRGGGAAGAGRRNLLQSQSIGMGDQAIELVDPVLREEDGLPSYDDAAPEYAASAELEAVR